MEFQNEKSPDSLKNPGFLAPPVADSLKKARQPEVPLDELDHVAKQNVAQASLAAVDLGRHFGPDATAVGVVGLIDEVIFVDVDANAHDGSVFGGSGRRMSAAKRCRAATT